MAERTISYNFRGDFKNLAAGLAVMGKGVSDLGVKLTALDKNGAKMRAGLTAIGSTAGKVGLVAAAGFTVAVAAAANFDKAMSSVQAATHETAGNMALLRQAAIDAGQATVFSASEAAGAIEELAKAGVSTTAILDGGLTGALNLASAGSISVADAASIAATALTQFKLAGDDVPHVADELAAAAGKAQGDVSDMGMALKQSGLVAAQFGLSLDDTVGSLAAFASAGLLGSDAGTSFKQLLLSLASPSNKAADAMQNLGIQAYDAQGKFVGITDLAGQLQVALENKTQAERDSALATIFGSDAIRAANVLYTQGADGIQGWIDKTNDQGYAADTAAIKLDNLSGDLEQLRGSLETAFIGAGSGSQGPLRQLVQGVTNVVNAFNKVPQSGQNAATGMLAVTAVLGGGLWFTAKTISGISNTRKALDDLGYSSERVGRNLKVIGGLAGAATVLTLVGDAAQEMIERTDQAAPSVEALTRSLIGLNSATQVQSLVGDLGDLQGAMASLDDPNFAQSVYKFYDSIPSGVGKLTNILVPGLEGAGQESRDAAASISALDDALANIVNQGSPEQAAQAFDDLAVAYGLTADQQEELKALLPGYQEALDATANSTALAAGATKTYGVNARTAKQATSELNDEIRKQREAAKSTADAFIGLGDSLNDSKKSLGEWLHSLEQQAIALRNFRQNAEAAADKGLREGLIKALEEAGPEGALRMKQLANATDTEIKRANKAWESGQKQVKLYTDAIGGVPTKIHTDVDISTDEAKRSVMQIRAMLASLPDAVHTNYYINTIRSATKPELHAPAGSADGSTVPKGGTYADKHLYLLAPGEEVISNRHGQADRNRGLLKAINAGALADGGTAGVARSLDSRLEIAQILQQLRDMHQQLAARVKKGDHKGELVASGLSRRVLELQLQAAERDLRRAKHADEREAAAAAKEKRQKGLETGRGVRSAARGFDLTADMDAAAVSDLFASLRDSVKGAGGSLPANFKDLKNEAVSLATQLTKANDEYEKTTQSLTDMRSAAKDFGTQVGGIFNNDIFAKGGLNNAMLQLQADTNDTNARNDLLKQIAALGIDTSSDAFKSLASSADMQTLQDLNTAPEVKAFEAWFDSRATAQQQAGDWAAQVAFQPAIDALVTSASDQKQLITDLTAQLEAIQEKAATSVLWATAAGSESGTRAGVIAGLSGQKKKSNSKARTR